MPVNKLFVDTWGWVTYSSKREARHYQVRAFLNAFHGQIFTSDYVLDETITLLYARYPNQAEVAIRSLLRLIEAGHIIHERITDDRFDAAWRLRQRYGDKPAISFTDLTSMVIMQEHTIGQILTEDRHFEQVGLGLQRVPEPA